MFPFKTLPAECSHLKSAWTAFPLKPPIHFLLLCMSIHKEMKLYSCTQLLPSTVLFKISFLYVLLTFLSTLYIFVLSRALTFICYETNADTKTMSFILRDYGILLFHGSTVLVGPWPPSRPSSSHLFCAHVSSSLWHPFSSGPPSRRPSTLTLVFLHSYFILACSDITSLPPFPHSSSPCGDWGMISSIIATL